MMADTRTMAELLQAPTEGYGDAIIIPAILAENFELKHGLLNLRFKDLLRTCPHHGFTELHQIDTFYNSLTSTDQDSLNAAAGGNLLTKTSKDALTIIENKSKVRTSRNKPVITKASTNTSTSSLSPDVAALTDVVKALLLKNTTPPPASVKAVEESCVTCGGPHPYYQCLATDGNLLTKTPKNALTLIENKSKVRTSRNRPVVAKVSTSTSTSGLSPDVATRTDAVKALLLNSTYRALTPPTQAAPSNQSPPEVVFLTMDLRFLLPSLLLPRRWKESPSLGRSWASINLMPLSIWRKLLLPELTPTQMILELADRSTTIPTDIAEDVFVRVGKYSDNDAESINRIDVIDIAYEEYSQEVLGFSNNSESGNPTPISEPIIAKSSPSLTLFEGGDFILEEIKACFASDSIPSGIDDAEFDLEGDIHLIEEILNKDPYSPLPLKDLKYEELKSVKSLVDEPLELELKDLPSHLEYTFLEGTNKLPIIIAKNLKDEEKERLIKVLKSHKQAIAWKLSDTKGIDSKLNDATRKDHFLLPFMDQMLERLAGNEYYFFLDGFFMYFQIPIDPQDQEKKTFTCPYGTFAYRCMPFGLCNAPGTFQRWMMAIFHDMIEETREVFMDDFSVFWDSFSSCLSHLDKMLKMCEDTNLVLNWERCHFMVKEGIVFIHKILKSGIEVDRVKVDVIAKLPPSTSVKGIWSFLGHAGFYLRFIQDFSKIAWPMTHLLEKETPFIFSTECREAFETLKKKLTEAPILVAPD
ncbi:reverse transcriptase domain-containing protein [Tanacetum coccineum]